uniref:Uncharacterized protein n=1 Tax=Glossina pallidipes TaxID=7398 RepID=A0A1B0AEH2_GLOPL
MKRMCISTEALDCASRIIKSFRVLVSFYNHIGDIFAGINDGILSRAEALAAVDMGKHQATHVHSQMPSQIKHDVMYHHHSISGPPQRPLQKKGELLYSKRCRREKSRVGQKKCKECIALR